MWEKGARLFCLFIECDWSHGCFFFLDLIKYRYNNVFNYVFLLNMSQNTITDKGRDNYIRALNGAFTAIEPLNSIIKWRLPPCGRI